MEVDLLQNRIETSFVSMNICNYILQLRTLLSRGFVDILNGVLMIQMQTYLTLKIHVKKWLCRNRNQV